MPGYILHLTAAQILIQKSNEKLNVNDFLVGNLLPDTVKEKTVSHFRSPARYGKRIEYPELQPFLDKYKDIMKWDSVKGYLYHLYIDRKFMREYLPTIVTFLDEQGQEDDETKTVTQVLLHRTGEKIPIKQFFSEEYYYGDFTKMNTYLIEHYQVPLNLKIRAENPEIGEVNYQDVEKVLGELKSYLGVPKEAVEELNVFEMESLLRFLENAAEEWIDKEIGNCF